MGEENLEMTTDTDTLLRLAEAVVSAYGKEGLFEKAHEKFHCEVGAEDFIALCKRMKELEVLLKKALVSGPIGKEFDWQPPEPEEGLGE